MKLSGNYLISRFYEQFSRSSRNFRPFLEVQKNFKLLEHKHIIYEFEVGDLMKIIGWGGGWGGGVQCTTASTFILQNCVIVSYKKDELHVF